MFRVERQEGVPKETGVAKVVCDRSRNRTRSGRGRKLRETARGCFQGSPTPTPASLTRLAVPSAPPWPCSRPNDNIRAALSPDFQALAADPRPCQQTSAAPGTFSAVTTSRATCWPWVGPEGCAAKGIMEGRKTLASGLGVERRPSVLSCLFQVLLSPVGYALGWVMLFSPVLVPDSPHPSSAPLSILFPLSPLSCLTANRPCPPESGSSMLLCVCQVPDVPVFLSIQFCVGTVGTGQGSEPDRQQLQSPREFSSPARVRPALGKGDCRLLQMSKPVESAWTAYA